MPVLSRRRSSLLRAATAALALPGAVAVAAPVAPAPASEDGITTVTGLVPEDVLPPLDVWEEYDPSDAADRIAGPVGGSEEDADDVIHTASLEYDLFGDGMRTSGGSDASSSSNLRGSGGPLPYPLAVGVDPNALLEGIAGLFNGTHTGATDRRLATSADWRPWPLEQVSGKALPIIHRMCDDEWSAAVTQAASSWSQMSDALELVVRDGGCSPRVNGDLTYIADAIHVVYGTCGSGCCGRANVEYSYRTNGQITRYASLVRIDPECFAGNNPEGKRYLACHELGHALGLGHNLRNSQSCLASYKGQLLPGADDVDVLDKKLYKGATHNGGSSYGQQPPQYTTPQYLPVSSTSGGTGGQTTVGYTPRPAAVPQTPKDFSSLALYQTEARNQNDPSAIDGSCPTGRGMCGRCQGDCDTHADCSGSLQCFFRSGLAKIPGCNGLGESHKDYCYDPADYDPATYGQHSGTGGGVAPPTVYTNPHSQRAPTRAPTYYWQGPAPTWNQGSNLTPGSAPGVSSPQALTPVPVPASTSTGYNPIYAPPPSTKLDFVSYKGGNCDRFYKCGLCQGDCDTDLDCSGGLVCYQRQGWETIPGCQGYGGQGADYCSYAPSSPNFTDPTVVRQGTTSF